MKRRILILLMFLSLLPLAGCGGDKPVTAEEARGLIAALPSPKPDILDTSRSLREMTPERFFQATGAQLFKDEGCETYLICKGKATVLGNGFGGYGVVQAEPCDFDGDGNKEILYTYSFGSGIHRAMLAVYDLDEDKNSTATLITWCDMVLERVSDTEFTIYEGKDGQGDLLDPKFQKGFRLGRIVADSAGDGGFTVELDELIPDNVVWMK